MLGAAAGTPGSVATLVESYRAHGFFSRWPVQYIATGGHDAISDEMKSYGKALGDFTAALVRHPRMAVHLHISRHSFWRQAPFAAAALAARRPLIVQVHGAGLGGEARMLLERAACVVVACEAQRLWVKSLARRAEVLCVPPPAPAAIRPLAPRPSVVLFLGRLAAGKGIFDLLDAIVGVRASVPDVRLVCAGRGDRAGILRHAERLGIADAVKLTGWVGPSGKRALLETAAAFALPSYDEALPVSLIEAMSAGVPPVVSPVGGIPEVVQEGVSGFFVAPGDRAGLARRLKRLLLDRALAERIGTAARESARLRFAPERVLARLDDLYGSLGVVRVGTPAPGAGDAGLKKAA